MGPSVARATGHAQVPDTGTVALLVVVSGTLALAELRGVTPALPSTTFSNPSLLSYTVATGAFTVASTPTATKFDWTPSPVINSSDFSNVRVESGTGNADVLAVPEPATMALLLLGGGAVAWRTRRRSMTPTQS